MKSLILLCVLALFGLAVGQEQRYPRGCIYIMGECEQECEVGTRAYTTGCGRKMPEATCEEPNPVLEDGIICGYSACYCEPPTLRDTASGKCVQPADCPKKA